MSASTVPDIGIARRAILLGTKGFRVVQVYPNDKAPVGLEWPKRATSDVDTLTQRFRYGTFNAGVACGPQPNDLNLVVVDVDTKHDGMERWAELTARHELPPTVTHSTPSGGLHVYFTTPLTVRNGRLMPGIDIRGDGGQVLVPPSWRIIDGVKVHYAEVDDRGLWHFEVALIPEWLLEMLVRPPVVERPTLTPQPSTNGGGLTNADWFADHFDWHADLEGRGHTLVKHVGEDAYYRHPTATCEHSAVVHLGDNFMVAFSTNMPAALRERQVNRDGSVSWTPYDWWVASDFDGDYSEATRVINRRRMPLTGADAGRAVQAPAPADGDDTPLNLPADFWTARPVLTQIRDAAWSAKCSPDALLVQALARVATFVHPCFKLPGVEQGLIGKHQTLDFLGCVVAETSGGKTMAAGVGEMLVPAPEPPVFGEPLIDFEQRVGSGEGIAEFFLVPEMREDEDGKLKPTGRRIIGRQALFMNVDEGTGFTNQAGRKGATIVSTLASAWSGESLGQLNAASETRRLVQGGRVRICAVINMQDSNGYKLYADDLESVGFTGRLLFASAHDPSAPEQSPPWPGRLRWPIKAGSVGTNVYYTYDPAIVAEIKNDRHQVLTKQVRIDRRQSQYLLLRCKVAALLATVDGRTTVTVEDWALATEVVTMSARVLFHLDSVHTSQNEVTAVTAASFKMKVTEKAQSMHVRQLQVTWKAKLLERLSKRGPLPWKGLKDLVESARRQELREALEALVDEGLVELTGSTYQRP